MQLVALDNKILLRGRRHFTSTRSSFSGLKAKIVVRDETLSIEAEFFVEKEIDTK
jgi:hypothetical protein